MRIEAAYSRTQMKLKYYLKINKLTCKLLPVPNMWLPFINRLDNRKNH